MIYLSKKVSLRLSCLLHYDFSSDEIFERSLVFGYWFHDISFVDSCRIIDTQTWVKLNRLNSIVGFKFIKKLFPSSGFRHTECFANFEKRNWVFETLKWSWLNNLKSLSCKHLLSCVTFTLKSRWRKANEALLTYWELIWAETCYDFIFNSKKIIQDRTADQKKKNTVSSINAF